jgi:hypothetical protein
MHSCSCCFTCALASCLQRLFLAVAVSKQRPNVLALRNAGGAPQRSYVSITVCTTRHGAQQQETIIWCCIMLHRSTADPTPIDRTMGPATSAAEMGTSCILVTYVSAVSTVPLLLYHPELHQPTGPPSLATVCCCPSTAAAAAAVTHIWRLFDSLCPMQ